MYSITETSKAIPFGESTIPAVKTWTDGYGKISMVEDDNCLVFILESTGRKLFWIPKEIIDPRTDSYIPSGVVAQERVDPL